MIALAVGQNGPNRLFEGTGRVGFWHFVGCPFRGCRCVNSGAVVSGFAAVSFATENASNHVADLVLSNVGPYNVRFAFVYGTFIEFAILAALFAHRPNRLPFALKAMALFLLVRAVAHPHRAVADRSGEAGAVSQRDLFRQRPILLRPHRPAISRGADVLAHAVLALLLSRLDRVLRHGSSTRSAASSLPWCAKGSASIFSPRRWTVIGSIASSPVALPVLSPAPRAAAQLERMPRD
jgi:hypothetical protein